MAEKAKKNSKELGIGKILIILFMVLFLVPILIIGVVYSTNDNFKLTANKYFIQLPGPIGNYFESYPTMDELSQQYQTIAEYLIRIDLDRAKDKLILMQNDNDETYNNIVKLMLQMDSNRTSKLLEEIRKSSIKEDMIISTLEEIENERTDKIMNIVNYYSNLSTLSALNEINSSLNNNSITYKELGVIFENMKEENAATLLKNLDENVSKNIFNSFTSNEKSRKLRELITSMRDSEEDLIDMAYIYSTEAPEKLVSVIGNTDNYSIDELSVIYRNIGILKGAKTLAQIDNVDFSHSLIKKIKEKEILATGEDNITEDLTRGISIYRQFQQNISDLSNIYGKMDENRVAELIKQMIRNGSSPAVYQLNNSEQISISDEDLALGVLKSFNERKIGVILSYLDNNLSSEISKKLTIPEL